MAKTKKDLRPVYIPDDEKNRFDSAQQHLMDRCSMSFGTLVRTMITNAEVFDSSLLDQVFARESMKSNKRYILVRLPDVV